MDKELMEAFNKFVHKFILEFEQILLSAGIKLARPFSEECHNEEPDGTISFTLLYSIKAETDQMDTIRLSFYPDNPRIIKCQDLRNNAIYKFPDELHKLFMEFRKTREFLK